MLKLCSSFKCYNLFNLLTLPFCMLLRIKQAHPIISQGSFLPQAFFLPLALIYILAILLSPTILTWNYKLNWHFHLSLWSLGTGLLSRNRSLFLLSSQTNTLAPYNFKKNLEKLSDLTLLSVLKIANVKSLPCFVQLTNEQKTFASGRT